MAWITLDIRWRSPTTCRVANRWRWGWSPWSEWLGCLRSLACLGCLFLLWCVWCLWWSGGRCGLLLLRTRRGVRRSLWSRIKIIPRWSPLGTPGCCPRETTFLLAPRPRLFRSRKERRGLALLPCSSVWRCCRWVSLFRWGFRWLPSWALILCHGNDHMSWPLSFPSLYKLDKWSQLGTSAHKSFDHLLRWTPCFRIECKASDPLDSWLQFPGKWDRLASSGTCLWWLFRCRYLQLRLGWWVWMMVISSHLLIWRPLPWIFWIFLIDAGHFLDGSEHISSVSFILLPFLVIAQSVIGWISQVLPSFSNLDFLSFSSSLVKASIFAFFSLYARCTSSSDAVIFNPA